MGGPGHKRRTGYRMAKKDTELVESVVGNGENSWWRRRTSRLRGVAFAAPLAVAFVAAVITAQVLQFNPVIGPLDLRERARAASAAHSMAATASPGASPTSASDAIPSVRSLASTTTDNVTAAVTSVDVTSTTAPLGTPSTTTPTSTTTTSRNPVSTTGPTTTTPTSTTGTSTTTTFPA